MTDGVDAVRGWGGGMWDQFVRLAAEPRGAGVPPERRLALLDAEADVIDLFRRYHSFYESNEIERVLDLFSDDCVVINPRGTYAGKDAIRANYAYLIARRRFVIHYGTNPMVRFENDDFTQGWLTAYYFSVSLSTAGAMWSVGGTYIDHMRKTNGKWEIFEQRITGNFQIQIGDVAPPPPSPPDGTHPGSSRDIIEASFLM